MNIEEASVAVKEKYKIFWDDVFEDRTHFDKMMTDNPYFYIMKEWDEFGYRLIEYCDGDMHAEIVIIKT
jgi:2-polyprenyl-6-methoxyphenol hydroxylase-like FAD-dependent oxidoreductase